MKKIAWIGVLIVSALPLSTTAAGDRFQNPRKSVDVLNQVLLHGKIMDHTHNHGHDNRIWSRYLYCRRDLYVYVPPGFNPHQRYPLVLWLHGFGQDEQSFVEYVAPLIDEAIFTGKLPPVIVAAPDGSLTGEPTAAGSGSFFLNSLEGDFEDYLLQDVWDFVVDRYPIRCERCAHVIAGFSMGGFSAYNLAFKHRECFGVVIGVMPPLNLRWVNRKGKYYAKFDPKDWAWRTKLDEGGELFARFHCGLLPLRVNQVLDPLLGNGSEALQEVARENPIEMIDRLPVRPGELSMYVAYGGKDQFNVDAQVESFLYLARWRGLAVKVGYEPKGRHDVTTAENLFPGIVAWLAPQIAPYSPVGIAANPCVACSAPCAGPATVPPAVHVVSPPLAVPQVTQALPPSLPPVASPPGSAGDSNLLPSSQAAGSSGTGEESSSPTGPKPDLLIPPSANYDPGQGSEIQAGPLLGPLLSGAQ